MKKWKISKRRLAAVLTTSRTQVVRLLDPMNEITLSRLQGAAGEDLDSGLRENDQLSSHCK
jgi:hypothetical protein